MILWEVRAGGQLWVCCGLVVASATRQFQWQFNNNIILLGVH